MLNTSTKILLLFLMLASFVGQAGGLFVSAPCVESNESVTSHVIWEPHQAGSLASNAQSDSSQPTMADTQNSLHNDNEECCDDHCCKAGCVCVGNTCSGTVYLTHHVRLPQGSPVKASLGLPLITMPLSLSSVLYRPPILLS